MILSYIHSCDEEERNESMWHLYLHMPLYWFGKPILWVAWRVMIPFVWCFSIIIKKQIKLTELFIFHRTLIPQQHWANYQEFKKKKKENSEKDPKQKRIDSMSPPIRLYTRITATLLARAPIQHNFVSVNRCGRLADAAHSTQIWFWEECGPEWRE